MRPPLQERFQIYVLGPNQDARLASVAAGAVVEKVNLKLDTDAPFVLRSRAVRRKYSALTQNGLQFIKTQWTGPQADYRQSDYILESLQQPYFGQGANWKPVSPEITYPPGGIITIDVQNTGPSALTNLTFYWIGVNLYPWGTVPSRSYPANFAAFTFSYPIQVVQLGPGETRIDNLFTCKQDADFVWRAGLAEAIFGTAGCPPVGAVLAEIALIIKDRNKFPFMNDYVHFDILFGSAGTLRTIPIGPTPFEMSTFGAGPSSPGLFYPEFYIPKNHQFWFDIQRSDGTIAGNTPADVNWNMIGAKVEDQ